jgi:hypothetical protein
LLKNLFCRLLLNQSVSKIIGIYLRRLGPAAQRQRQVFLSIDSVFSGFEKKLKILSTSRRITRPNNSRNRARGKLKTENTIFFKPNHDLGF